MNGRQTSDRPAESSKPLPAAEQRTHDACPHIVGVAAGYPPKF